MLILAFVGLFSYRATKRLIEIDTWVNESHDVFDQVDALLLEVLEVESSAHAYVLGGKDYYLEPSRIALGKIDQIQNSLQRMTERNPRLRRRIQAMRRSIEEKIAYHQSQIKMRSSSAYKPAVDILATGTGHALMDKIRDIADEVKGEEKALLQQHEAEARSAAHQSIHLLISGFILAFAILLSVYWNLMREISRRKQAVEQIKKLNEELERRVEQRTRELAVANSELALRNQEVERANRLKSEFLANMSHELRTPLNAIIGFSDLLAEEKTGLLETKQKRFVGHISAGAHHLLKLINEILDISKIEAGRIDLEPESFDAATALTEVLLVISPLAVNKKIQVDSRVGNDATIFADRIRFKQILYNLLSNALKFTPELGKAWIDATREAEGIIRFSVGDTGMGIPAEERAAVFDEFHQVSETTKGIKEGAGLGLAITRRLVELSGGRIWVESEQGKGSTFYFTLPSIPPSTSARFSSDIIPRTVQ